ncbi:hypothetical protein Anapl_06951 [Anas platyrhynchos]|uniref:Uncharacterized protein n=1 Tax=Anas platyrhynchos TaxID=8839 RepID=R0LQD9_ANAPL|nr:hypothetical protein Anapl_06951 [Anas platyrhynchos]
MVDCPHQCTDKTVDFCSALSLVLHLAGSNETLPGGKHRDEDIRTPKQMGDCAHSKAVEICQPDDSGVVGTEGILRGYQLRNLDMIQAEVEELLGGPVVKHPTHCSILSREEEQAQPQQVTRRENGSPQKHLSPGGCGGLLCGHGSVGSTGSVPGLDSVQDGDESNQEQEERMGAWLAGCQYDVLSFCVKVEHHSWHRE